MLRKLGDGTYRLEWVTQCLCGSEDSITIATQDRFGLPVGVVACRRCGLARTNPRLHSDDVEAFYRDDYHGLHMGIPEPTPDVALFKTGQGSRIYGLLRHELPTTVRLAEIGCGTGRVMREFVAAAARDGIHVEAAGCEYAPAYVAAGEAAGSTIRLGSIETLVDLGPFEVVIMSHVLEHFTDVPRDLAATSELLSDHGIVYVEVPGLTAIDSKPEYDYDLVKYVTLAHTYHFSLGTLANVMARAGYVLISGDEDVRALFRRGPSMEITAATHLDQLLDYLEWLRTSPRMRVKRFGRRLRRFALDSFARLVGNRGYEAARNATRAIRSR